jgi:excisionase family DNA binding protein
MRRTTMASVAEQTISVSEAAERLGITTEEAYELVFARRLRTVETATGRRVVPIEALGQLRGQQESADEPV